MPKTSLENLASKVARNSHNCIMWRSVIGVCNIQNHKQHPWFIQGKYIFPNRCEYCRGSKFRNHLHTYEFLGPKQNNRYIQIQPTTKYENPLHGKSKFRKVSCTGWRLFLFSISFYVLFWEKWKLIRNSVLYIIFENSFSITTPKTSHFQKP